MLPGYPKEENGQLNLVFYVRPLDDGSLSKATTIPKESVIAAIQSATTTIEKAVGKTISKINAYVAPKRQTSHSSNSVELGIGLTFGIIVFLLFVGIVLRIAK